MKASSASPDSISRSSTPYDAVPGPNTPHDSVPRNQTPNKSSYTSTAHLLPPSSHQRTPSTTTVAHHISKFAQPGMGIPAEQSSTLLPVPSDHPLSAHPHSHPYFSSTSTPKTPLMPSLPPPHPGSLSSSPMYRHPCHPLSGYSPVESFYRPPPLPLPYSSMLHHLPPPHPAHPHAYSPYSMRGYDHGPATPPHLIRPLSLYGLPTPPSSGLPPPLPPTLPTSNLSPSLHSPLPAMQPRAPHHKPGTPGYASQPSPTSPTTPSLLTAASVPLKDVDTHFNPLWHPRVII